jgi:hypothetical protein
LELLNKGISIIRLTGYLEEDNQLGREVASKIAKKAYFSFNIQKSNSMIKWGGLWLVLGLIATGLSIYMGVKSDKFIFYIFYGAIIGGGGQVLRGIFKRQFAFKNFKLD